jgi:hypothetical protein
MAKFVGAFFAIFLCENAKKTSLVLTGIYVPYFLGYYGFPDACFIYLFAFHTSLQQTASLLYHITV